MAGTPRTEHPQLEITDLEQLQAWFAEHHETATGVWLVTWKRSTDPDRHVLYDDVVRECRRVGWIDGQAQGVDERRSATRLTPRRPGSGWARTNQQRVAELTEAGLLLPRGQAVWLSGAKRPATREKRVAEIVDRAAQGLRTR